MNFLVVHFPRKNSGSTQYLFTTSIALQWTASFFSNERLEPNKSPESTAVDAVAVRDASRFDGNNGAFPVAELIGDKNGRLCGTTLAGGTYDYGTVFELPPVPEPATSVLLLIGTLALLSRRRVTVS